MLKVFVSSPYTASSPQDIDLNIAKARMIAITLWKMEFAVYCPHLNTAHFETISDLDMSIIIRGDLALLENMDAVFVGDGWENSKGCNLEIKRAKELSIPIFDSYVDIEKWKNIENIKEKRRRE